MIVHHLASRNIDWSRFRPGYVARCREPRCFGYGKWYAEVLGPTGAKPYIVQHHFDDRVCALDWARTLAARRYTQPPATMPPPARRTARTAKIPTSRRPQ